MASKANERFDRFMMTASQKKSGFENVRFVFSARSKVTGEARSFFIELYAVNPLLSPKGVVLGFTSRPMLSAADLQYALSGSASKNFGREELVTPSFVCVRAGLIGAGGRQVAKYFHYEQVRRSKKERSLTVGESVFSPSSLAGSVALSPDEVRERPEFLSASGSFSWNLRYESRCRFAPSYMKKTGGWSVGGAISVLTGTITMDGEEHVVTPEDECGYYDRNWGNDMPAKWFHLSSSHMSSIISGHRLSASCFAVQGEYTPALALYTKFEGQSVRCNVGAFSKARVTWDCSETPTDGDVPKLHWTASFHKGRHVLDVDMFCQADKMSVREYEIPSGGRRKLSMLTGSTGVGEIRMYRKIRKNLELIEHVTVENCLCEFGRMELPED